MGKFIFLVLIFAGIGYYVFNTYFLDKTIFSKGTIAFTVQEFNDKELIPKKFTCDGQDYSPSFLIERVPTDTKSLTIIVEDVDAPSFFTNYILFNIDPATTAIEQNTTPAGTVTATNDFGKQEYNGPCHQLGTHRYSFKIFALDKELALDQNAKRVDVDYAMKGSIIAKGEYFGEYTKN